MNTFWYFSDNEPGAQAAAKRFDGVCEPLITPTALGPDLTLTEIERTIGRFGPGKRRPGGVPGFLIGPRGIAPPDDLVWNGFGRGYCIGYSERFPPGPDDLKRVEFFPGVEIEAGTAWPEWRRPTWMIPAPIIPCTHFDPQRACVVPIGPRFARMIRLAAQLAETYRLDGESLCEAWLQGSSACWLTIDLFCANYRMDDGEVLALGIGTTDTINLACGAAVDAHVLVKAAASSLRQTLADAAAGSN